MGENGFGPGQRKRDFFEAAKEDGCWVNLVAPNLSYSGVITGYNPGSSIMTLGRYVGYVYSPEGKKCLAIRRGALEVDLKLIPFFERERVTAREVRAKVMSFNLDLAHSAPHLFWDRTRKPTDIGLKKSDEQPSN